MALALCACVVVRLHMMRHAEMIARDGATYLQMARQWSSDPHGVVHNYDYHVGYPVAVAWMHKAVVAAGLTEDAAQWERAGCLVSLLAALAAMVALWLFAGMTFNWPIACITVLLFSFAWKWASLGAQVMSDSLAIAFQMWAAVLTLACLSLLRRNSPWSLLAAATVGLCAGAGYLVRPESLLMVLLALGLWISWQLFDRSLSRRLTIGSVTVALLTAIACAMPYMLAIGTLTKKKRLSDIVFGPGCPSHGIWPLAAASPLGAQHSALSTLSASIYQLGVQLVEAMHPVPFILATLWLLAWGLFRLIAWDRKKPFTPEPQVAGGLFILGAAGAIVPISLRLHANVRYLDFRHVMLLAMLLSPLAGAAVYLGANLLTDLLFRSSAKTRSALLFVLTPVAIFPMLSQLRRPLHDGKSYYRQAGTYLAGILQPGDHVLSHDPWIFYYARTTGEYLYVQGLDARSFVHCVSRQNGGATYVVLSDKELQEKNAALMPYLRPPVFRELSQFAEQRQHPNDSIHIWQLNRDALPRAASGR